MRISSLLFVLLLSACAAWPKPDLVDSLWTSNGVRVDYAKCDTPVETGDYTFQFHNVRLVKNGEARNDPKFRFDKPGLTELTGAQANSLLRMLDVLRRNFCFDVSRQGSSKAKEEFFDRLFKQTFEVALKFDTLSTEEEFKAEIKSAHAQLEQLRAEQESGYSTDGASK